MRKSNTKVPSFISDLIADPFSFANNQPPLTVEQIEILIKYLIKQERPKPNNIRLGNNYEDLLIIGDLHGDLRSTVKVTRPFLEEKVGSLLFLGDFVDRGNNSLVVLCYLIALAVSWPSRIQLLKGNHEDLNLNRRYGFDKEIRTLYPKNQEFKQVIDLLDEIYNNLSICAITPQSSFCCHGGVPAEFDNLEDFNLIPKPHSDLVSIRDMDLQLKLLSIYGQICWNDPLENQKDNFEFSIRGPGIFTFNEEATKIFLEKTNCVRLIRAHESSRGGFQSLFDGKLLHIFSSQPYFGKIKQAYVIHETIDGKTYLRQINFDLDKEIIRV